VVTYVRWCRLAVPFLACALAGCGRKAEPMGQVEYEKLVLEAVDVLEARQDSLEEELGLDSLRRVEWDQRTGELVFSDSAGKRVVAKVQFVGSLSKSEKTWLWAWANPTVEDNVKSGSQSVRRYGERYGISRLTEEKWAADEKAGWEMTALSALILNARGAWRTESPTLFTYLVITGIGGAAETAGPPPPAPVSPAPAPAPPPTPRDTGKERPGAGWAPPK
jgi:hypothetical protein